MSGAKRMAQLGAVVVIAVMAAAGAYLAFEPERDAQDMALLTEPVKVVSGDAPANATQSKTRQTDSVSDSLASGNAVIPIEQAALRLVAVAPSQQQAVIARDSGQMQAVAAGDALAGYGVTIVQVTGDKLVLRDDQSRETLWMTVANESGSEIKRFTAAPEIRGEHSRAIPVARESETPAN